MNQVSEILHAVQSCLPSRRPILHHEPSINHKYVLDACIPLTTGYVRAFEEKLRDITGAEEVIATNSGTAALHTALLTVGIQPGEEVLIPTSTFVATANAVCHVGATPHFIDGGLTLSPAKIRQYLNYLAHPAHGTRGRYNKRTGHAITAIIPVHLLGFPVDMAGIMEVAEEFGLTVIEDAAQAMGSKFDGKHCGTLGAIGVLSFNNNKTVTTNGGGAILTNDSWLAVKARQLANTARVPHPWLVEHDCVAWNYRMGNVNAALGLEQLERLDEILSAKVRVAERYCSSLSGIGGVKYLTSVCDSGTKPNHWLVSITVDKDLRDKLLFALHVDGIRARALFTPLHRLPMFCGNPRSAHIMAESDELFETTVCLPSGPGLV